MTYFRGVSQSGLIEFIVWQQDGRAFEVLATTGKGVDPIDLARSVRPATGGEWAAATTAVAPDFPRTTPSSVAPDPTTPAMAPQPATVRDVPVTVTATERPGRGGITVQSALPDGSHVPITLLRDGETTSVGIEGQFVTFSGGDDDSVTVNAVFGTSSWGAYVLTTDARAAFLRVTRATGDRYVAALVPDPAHPGAFVAAITVPIDEFVGADVVDQFGKKMDAFGLPAD